MTGLSRRRARELSERLRAAEAPAPEDIAALGDHLIRFNRALESVAASLRSVGLAPTTRLKTSGTIVEKLKRQRHLNLLTIRDLAGARVVRRMTLSEQNQVADTIRGLWPDAQLIDRRASPSHGYRAVHIVPRVDGCPVEIQLRTLYQDLWAQVMEMFGVRWTGGSSRYGGSPNEPDAATDGGNTRDQMVTSWKQMSDVFHALGRHEDQLSRMDRDGEGDSEGAREIRRQIEHDFEPARRLVASLTPLFQTG